MKRNAFTMMELLVGIMILAITSAVVIVNVNALKGQTAKREAEKLAHWLTNQMSIADSRNENFSLKSDKDGIALWPREVEVNEADKIPFKASSGCTLQLNADNTYSVKNNNFTKGGHIKVFGKEGPTAPYYVIIDTIGGRIRVDDKAP